MLLEAKGLLYRRPFDLNEQPVHHRTCRHMERHLVIEVVSRFRKDQFVLCGSSGQ